MAKKETFMIYFLVIFASYMMQGYLIYPVEAMFRTDPYLENVSYVFIPHGMKTLYALLLGPPAFIYIFLAQFFFAVLAFGNTTTAPIGALIGTVAVIAPILLINASLKRPLWKPPIDSDNISINVLWLYLSVALVSSFINGLSHQLLYGLEKTNLQFMMIVGDMVGSILIFMVILFLFRPLMNNYLLGKKYEQSSSLPRPFENGK